MSHVIVMDNPEVLGNVAALQGRTREAKETIARALRREIALGYAHRLAQSDRLRINPDGKICDFFK